MMAMRIQVVVVNDGRRIGNPKSQDPNPKSQEMPNGNNRKMNREGANRRPGQVAAGMLLYGPSTY